MIINGKEISSNIINNLKKEISAFDKKPTLCVIQIGNDEASNIYIKQKQNKCNELGIDFKHIVFSENENNDVIENKIHELNSDKNITGIILQLPIPHKFNANKLINLIDYKKDVDGLTNINRINLLNNEECLIPCTPAGIIELFKAYNIDVKGKNVVIVGRSNLVSKPLFNLLLNMDATITICHSKTIDLKKHTKNADILISATGKPHLIKEDMVKDGAIIIDVGICKIDGKLYGDVDFDNIKDKVSYITPVPGGVGPMTISMLMKNIVEAYKKNSK